MRSGDRDRFLELISALAASFRTEATEPLLMGYWIGLQDMAIEDFERAATKAIATCRFMPVPAELRDLAGTGQAIAAMDAWQAVIGAMRSVGRYRGVDFGPLVNAVIRNLGGWTRLCNTDSDELHSFTRKDFERVYATMSARPVEHLSGEHFPATLDDAPVIRVAIGPAESKRMLNGGGHAKLAPVDRE